MRKSSKNLTVGKLKKLYYSTKATCCNCGCTMKDWSGTGLGALFVLDKKGRFYCMNCEKDFEEGDERIFDANLYKGYDNNDTS